MIALVFAATKLRRAAQRKVLKPDASGLIAVIKSWREGRCQVLPIPARSLTLQLLRLMPCICETYEGDALTQQLAGLQKRQGSATPAMLGEDREVAHVEPWRLGRGPGRGQQGFCSHERGKGAPDELSAAPVCCYEASAHSALLQPLQLGPGQAVHWSVAHMMHVHRQRGTGALDGAYVSTLVRLALSPAWAEQLLSCGTA